MIEPHTAAMLAPYANAPATSGDTFWDPDEYGAFVVELERRGWQAFTHATGDRGIRVVLDAVARARAELGPADARHQLVHVECVHPDDVPRFGELGVVACMQPRHCAPDIVEEWRANVGPERERYAWPFRSIDATGGVLAFSSDWNVAEMDPMAWLYTACTRASPDGTGAWNLDERVDLATALRASTWGSAWSIRAEAERGTLTPGTTADVVVLSRDLASADHGAILDTHVTATVVGGEVVHRADPRRTIFRTDARRIDLDGPHHATPAHARVCRVSVDGLHHARTDLVDAIGLAGDERRRPDAERDGIAAARGRPAARRLRAPRHALGARGRRWDDRPASRRHASRDRGRRRRWLDGAAGGVVTGRPLDRVVGARGGERPRRGARGGRSARRIGSP